MIGRSRLVPERGRRAPTSTKYMRKKKIAVPEEAPIFTAQGQRTTVRRDQSDRSYTYRKINPDRHIMESNNSVNYCEKVIEEATRRGIEYHQIDVPGQGKLHLPHKRLLEEGRSPRGAKYPQKGVPLDRWETIEAPASPSGEVNEDKTMKKEVEK